MGLISGFIMLDKCLSLTTRKKVLGDGQYRRRRGYFRRPNAWATKLILSRVRRSNVEAQTLGGEFFRSTCNGYSITAKSFRGRLYLGVAFKFRSPYFILGDEFFLPPTSILSCVFSFSWPIVPLGNENFCGPCVFLGCAFCFCGPLCCWAMKTFAAHMHVGLRFLFSWSSTALRPTGHWLIFFWAMLFYLWPFANHIFSPF